MNGQEIRCIQQLVLLALPPGGRIACHKEADEDHHNVSHHLILHLSDTECQDECCSSNCSKQLAKGTQQEHALAPKLQTKWLPKEYGWLLISYSALLRI